jgi:hypothetical protein
MYEQLHEEVQTLHESTESFKLHTWNTTAELRHLIQVEKNANVPLEDSTSAATQPQFTPSTDADQVPVDVSPTTPALTPTQDTYAQKSLSEDETETNTSLSSYWTVCAKDTIGHHRNWVFITPSPLATQLNSWTN